MTEKKPLLFLHGYLADKSSFAAQTAYFKNYCDCRVFDLPGFGDNKDMPFPYSLDDYIAYVKEYMSASGLNKPDVIAHSFGARIAVKAAANAPELFGKLVITGGAGLKPRRKPSYYINKARFKLAKRFKKKNLLKYYSPDYRALSPVMRESFKLIVNEHLDDIAEKVKNKTLLIYGENDKETPPYMAKRYNKYIKDSKLVFLAGTGHFCFAETPYAFNVLVREFLLD